PMRQLRQQVPQVRVGVEGERIQLGGPVERDGRDPVRDLEPEMPPLPRQRDRSAKRAHGRTSGLTISRSIDCRQEPPILWLPVTRGRTQGVPSMELSPSAHTDTFCRDNLPPARQWPELRFDLAGLSYPDRLNCAAALLDDVVARFGPDRPCLRTLTEMWTYGDLLRRANQGAQVLVEDFGLVPGNRVLLRGPNNPWLIASWFAVL